MSSREHTIPFSILEVASEGSGVCIKENFINSLDLARKAEEFGYKRFWFAENHNMINLMVVSHVNHHDNRVDSFKIFSELMKERA